jgi:hypothetical protein
MEFDPSFDLVSYSRLPPNLDLPTTVALGRQLVAAAPARPSAGAKRTVVALAAATGMLESGMVSSLRDGPSVDKRPVDMRADRSWAAIELRLAAWLDLPPEENSETAAAGELHKLLFPDGLRFTQLEYGAQWAEAEARMQLLKKDRLEATLTELCGKAFVSELHRAHAAYGVMVGATGAAERKGQSGAPELSVLRKRAQQAILAYQIQLVAMCMAGDAAEQAAGREALRPIDEYREKLTPSRPKPEAPAPADPPANPTP